MLRLRLCLVVALLSAPAAARGDVNWEEAPIEYSHGTPRNVITRLQQQLDAGEVRLKFDPQFGYLPALLETLDIPVSSQIFVFSRTSLQIGRISPRTPRAIYFNDDVHIGYVQRGLLEFAVADPDLGTVFYTLNQNPRGTPTFVHETDRCLTCHGAGRSRHVPGVVARSVFTDRSGQVIIGAKSYLSTHASPFGQRWGGWYVTGEHGAQTHMGNATLGPNEDPAHHDNSAGQNVTDLSDRINPQDYLSPHSDIVALMVFEHQADGHNVFTKARFAARHALYARDRAVADAPAAAAAAEAAARERIAQAARSVVDHVLFANETPLTDPIRGTSTFTRDFASRGPLREFDLQTRMFKLPCSYLLTSPAFASFPEPLQAEVGRQLAAVLNAKSTDDYPQLSLADRRAIRATLSAANWKWLVP